MVEARQGKDDLVHMLLNPAYHCPGAASFATGGLSDALDPVV
jgi:hypothetical protein